MRIITILFLTIFLFLQSVESQQVKWFFNTFDSSFGQSAMADLDGDGKYEVVFGCYRNDSTLYVLNGEDGSLLWKYNTSAINAEGCNDTAPLIYDVDGDGLLDVINASSCTPITYCFEGATGEIKWQTPTRGSDSPPSIADLDGDGILEIMHGQFGGYVVCINVEDGTKLWDLEVDNNSWVQTAPSITDLDGDGLPDFVVATWNFDNDSKIYAYRGYDQKLLWTKDVTDYVYHGSAISDLDKDGKNEIILGDYDGMLYALNAEDGTEKWTFKSDYYIGAPVIVGDLDGDGFGEAVFTSYFKVYALRHDGSTLWDYSVPEYGQSFRGLALSDMNGNGLPDVVFCTDNGQLISLNGLTGNALWYMNLADTLGIELDFNHAPVIGDMDNDGFKDIFIVGGKTDMPDFSKNYGRAVCITTNATGDDEWLMFQANPRRTGTNTKDVTGLFNYSNNKQIKLIVDDIGNSVSLHGLKINSRIMIYDILGNSIYNKLNESESIVISTENFPRGVYMIQIGESNFKFIKK